MKLFSIYFSTLTFLIIELIGLVKGEPIGSILLKSVGVFLVLFFLGDAVAKFFEQSAKKEEEGEHQAPALEQGPVATDAQTEAYKQEAIRLAREKPKEVAQMFEVLINK